MKLNYDFTYTLLTENIKFEIAGMRKLRNRFR